MKKIINPFKNEKPSKRNKVKNTLHEYGLEEPTPEYCSDVYDQFNFGVSYFNINRNDWYDFE